MTDTINEAIEKEALQFFVKTFSTPEKSLAFLLQQALTRIATIAAAEEREACARVCDEIAWSNKNTPSFGPELNCKKCAAAIRARGQGNEKTV